MSTAEDQIHQLLATYEQSLNTSDAQLAADCYAPDGVFMPTTLPTASGADLHAAYTQIFANIRLELPSPSTSWLSPAISSPTP